MAHQHTLRSRNSHKFKYDPRSGYTKHEEHKNRESVTGDTTSSDKGQNKFLVYAHLGAIVDLS